MQDTKLHTIQSAKDFIIDYHNKNTSSESVTVYNIQKLCAEKVSELLSAEGILTGDVVIFKKAHTNEPSATFIYS